MNQLIYSAKNINTKIMHPNVNICIRAHIFIPSLQSIFKPGKSAKHIKAKNFISLNQICYAGKAFSHGLCMCMPVCVCVSIGYILYKA